MPIGHKINITPYWFLGFIEGEGSFSIGKSAVKNRFKFYSQFSLVLTESQKPVLDDVKFFIDQLGINPESIELNIARSNINFRKHQSITSKPEYALVISDIYFIYHFFIPFLDRLQFLTQKRMDYLNWKLGVQVLVKGLHLIEAGQIYLLELTSKMNSGRLTSNQTKIKSISGTGIDIFSFPPLYEFGSNGEIKVISSGRTVTEAKF